jgi:elongation factor Ts
LKVKLNIKILLHNDKMMKVDMDLLKSLRETTQAPLKDCKDALIEAEGDFDKALIVLKQKGLSKAAKKADRETNE